MLVFVILCGMSEWTRSDFYDATHSLTDAALPAEERWTDYHN